MAKKKAVVRSSGRVKRGPGSSGRQAKREGAAPKRRLEARTIFLVHWNEAEAEALARPLREVGHRVEIEARDGAKAGARVRDLRPDIVVISLQRLPSHGRQTGRYLASTKATRDIPIVFLGGEPEKVTMVRSMVPSATFTTREGLMASLVGERPRASPIPAVLPPSTAGYSGKPLIEKLGIRGGQRVCIMSAPEGYDGTLGMLPEGVRLVAGLKAPLDFVQCFCTKREELRARFPLLVKALHAGGMIWMCWPKGGSRIPTDLKEDVVRAAGLPLGLVDVKVCAVDQDWSGLKFVRRRVASALTRAKRR